MPPNPPPQPRKLPGVSRLHGPRPGLGSVPSPRAPAGRTRTGSGDAGGGRADLWGVQSSSQISLPMQVSRVASTASPNGTVSCGRDESTGPWPPSGLRAALGLRAPRGPTRGRRSAPSPKRPQLGALPAQVAGAAGPSLRPLGASGHTFTSRRRAGSCPELTWPQRTGSALRVLGRQGPRHHGYADNSSPSPRVPPGSPSPARRRALSASSTRPCAWHITRKSPIPGSDTADGSR